MANMWLRSARVVLANDILERGSIHVIGEAIVEIVDGDGPRPGSEASVDAAGLTILPGIIDFHGDMLERDMEPRPGVFFPADLALLELDKRLAATGITTAYASISFMESTGSNSLRTIERARSLVELINAVRASLLVDMRIHARYETTSPSATPIVLELIRAGQVDLVSLMDHTPGQGQYRDVVKYAEIIEQWRKVSKREADQMAQWRMSRAEAAGDVWEGTRLVADAALDAGLRVASHDDDTAEKVDRLVDLGVRLCEFPVTLVAATRARERGLSIAMGGPNLFLGGSHNGNLSAREAIEAGLVDMLVADYYPAALLHSAFELVRSGSMPLPDAWRLLSLNPAEALGLSDRGCIGAGYSADLVIVEESARPRVRGTVRRGVPIYWDGLLATRRSGGREEVASRRGNDAR
jgi:alpha-D-ribose 1-methylphosphonate 5-triphosphate diphosphatase